eukprot:CAMPEP_0194027086 /NCGR_PEP_ID=MMETSP0009_2-20130614/1315_1 /TAXON_ID=210454 /ORGANISM="Grammatophora oceanica, Strain CCMP 410" /LENGTH=175 /DNA_ID=CAMNT_0038666033 /DNA_START=1 /DNA_END=528 /DNA_ORIENTATION=-
MMRGVYHGLMGSPDESSIAPLSNETDVLVPFEVRNAGKKKGRGVFATQNISAGTLVWTVFDQTAFFKRGDDYRRFLHLLPGHTRCEAMQFSWVQTFEDHNNSSYARILVDLGEASLMNNGHSAKANLGYAPDGGSGTKKANMYAVRNIAAGEELLCNYKDFVTTGHSHGWDLFDL